KTPAEKSASEKQQGRQQIAERGQPARREPGRHRDGRGGDHEHAGHLDHVDVDHAVCDRPCKAKLGGGGEGGRFVFERDRHGSDDGRSDEQHAEEQEAASPRRSRMTPMNHRKAIPAKGIRLSASATAFAFVASHLYCLLAHQGGLELHCFCSRINNALRRIRRRKSPILICLDSARAAYPWSTKARSASGARTVTPP